MIIGQLAMQAIRRTVEEEAARDARLHRDIGVRQAVGDGSTADSWLRYVADCARVSADMAVHQHTGIRIERVEPAQAEVIRLLHIEAYAKALREHFEGIVDAMREAEGVAL